MNISQPVENDAPAPAPQVAATAAPAPRPKTKDDDDFDVYRFISQKCFGRITSRSGPASFILTLSLGFVVCGILLAAASVYYGDSAFVEALKPLRNSQDLVVSSLVATACITFVTGLWGITSFRVRNKFFIAAYGGLVAFLIIVHAGCAAIFDAMAGLKEEDLEVVCPGKDDDVNLATLESFLET